MRILLLIIQFPPDTNSTGRLMSQLSGEWAQCGHEVTVITTFPHYENFRIWTEYRGKIWKRSRERGVEIVRLFTYAPGSKTMINRLASYLVFNALAFVTGIFWRKRWDVILCTNGSFFTGIASWLLGKIKGAPFIYNVQDLYPEVPIRAGQLSNPQAIVALKSLENFMYRKAAHVTVISDSQRDNLIAKGVPEKKLSIVPNFVDTEFIRPLPKASPFAWQQDLSNKFVVAHAGNVGYVYDLDTLLDAARLLSSYNDIVFLIVGNGVAKPTLEKKARDLRLENLRFMPFQPYEHLPWLRAASDIQVSLYKNGAATESFPSKVYEVMASGRPLVASADGGSEVERLVQKVQCGLCVKPGDAEQLAEAILALYRDRSLRNVMGARGRRHVEEHHTKQLVAARYQDLFLKLCPAVLKSADFSRPLPSV